MNKLKLNSSIKKLNLKRTVFYCLQDENINTIGELLTKTDGELLKINNLGKIKLRQIKESLAEHGFSLDYNPPVDELDSMKNSIEIISYELNKILMSLYKFCKAMQDLVEK